MMYTVRVALLACAIAFATAADVNCEIGQKWVENYIKFECYSSTTIAKGIRPIGCVPTNKNDGAVIAAGATYDETHFRYKCIAGAGDSMAYQITNCFDSATPPKLMQPGESREMSDGSTVICYKEGDKIKKKVERVTGCKAADGKIYQYGNTWIVNLEKPTAYQKGVAMRCTQNGASGFVSTMFGCVTVNNAVITENQYGMVGDQVIRCMKSPNGDCQLAKVAKEDVQCKSEDSVYDHGVQWDNKAKDGRFRCNYGSTVKVGCYKDGTLVALHTIRYFDSTPFYCTNGKGYTFTPTTGCTLADKSFKKLGETWTTATGMFHCIFSIVNDGAQAFVKQTHCIYQSVTFKNDEIKLVKDVPMKCAKSDGLNLAVRKLTDAEMEAWEKSKKTNTNGQIIGGVDGSGNGSSMTKQTVPVFPTTTPTVTTTAAPITTTKVTTTAAPITTAEVTTTATPITTTKVTTTATAKTTTKVEGKECKDTLPICNELAPACADEIVDEALGQMTEILEKMTFPIMKEINLKEMLPKIEKSLPLLKASLPLLKENGVDMKDLPELEASLPLLKASLPLLKGNLPLLKQSLPLLKEMVEGKNKNSSEEVDESDCQMHRRRCEASGESDSSECEEHRRRGCGDCSDCHNKTRKPCKRCAVFKRKAKEFVQAVCPKTCNACDKNLNMDSIVKVFVKFCSSN